MIFKNLDLYFLSASSRVRWGISFIIIVFGVASWYFCAYLPVRLKIDSIRDKLQAIQHSNQQYLDKELLCKNQENIITQRLTRSGTYNNFLKDLLNAGFITKNITIEKSERIENYITTSFKVVMEGKFEDFFGFLIKSPAHYLYVWKQCVCIADPDGKLSIDADITLYSE